MSFLVLLSFDVYLYRALLFVGCCQIESLLGGLEGESRSKHVILRHRFLYIDPLL